MRQIKIHFQEVNAQILLALPGTQKTRGSGFLPRWKIKYESLGTEYEICSKSLHTQLTSEKDNQVPDYGLSRTMHTQQGAAFLLHKRQA